MKQRLNEGRKKGEEGEWLKEEEEEEEEEEEDWQGGIKWKEKKD